MRSVRFSWRVQIGPRRILSAQPYSFIANKTNPSFIVKSVPMLSTLHLRRRVLILCVLTLSCLMVVTVNQSLSQDKVSKTVSLIVDYGNGFERRYTALRWTENMTALDATRLASKHKQGFAILVKGSGATAFVTAIDGVENEGQGKNWMYGVNGKKGDRSSGVYKLSASDVVKWTFEVFDAD